jgi:type I restriction enzyme, S subunit
VREGWQVKPLGDVCTLQRGFDLPTHDRRPGAVPLVSSSGFIDTHDECRVHGPGVVTGRSGSIGNVFFVEGDFWPLNTTLYVKDFHGNAPRFVNYLLNAVDLKAHAGGTGVPTLNRNDVHVVPVMVPNELKEQHRIVALLDEAFEGIATAKANAETNLLNARELAEVLVEECFDRHADESFVPQALNDLCELIVDCEHKTAPIQGEGYPSIRTPNIGKGHLILNGVNRVSDQTYVEWTRRAVPSPGDLILAREAPAGNVAVIPDGAKVCLGQRTVLIRPRIELIAPRYLSHLLLQRRSQLRLLAHSRGATVQHINMKDIRAFKISCVPSLRMQQRVIEKLAGIEFDCLELEEAQVQKITALEELKKSLLHQAFSGEL